MTREEFWDSITQFWELRDFCQNESIYVTDDYFDYDDWNDEVQSDFDNCDWDSWEDCRDTLSRLEKPACDFFLREGYFYYTPCEEEDLDRLKQEVVEIMDERGAWDDDDTWDDDDEDENVDDDEYVYEDPKQPELNEGMSFDELSGFEVVKLEEA